MRHWSLGLIALALAVLGGTPGCGPTVRRAGTAQASPAPIEELWQSPTDLPQRDLFHGAGGAALAPRAESFAFVAQDKTGYSPGFDVRDAEGVEWSVKLGPEAQTEVTTSRILWSVGFHQPPTYYVAQWRMSGTQAGTQPGGRFRPTVSGRTVVGDWSWYDNPFMNSQEFRGLVVANLILNNWDWKTSNNKIYALSEPGRAPRRQFVVRDLGASLGKTSYPRWLKWLGLRGFGQGSRNDVDGFEQQGFVLGVNEDSTVEFDYRGIHGDLVGSLSPADVRWTCERLSRLSDQQWTDAFRAGGFSPEHGDRYIRKIKAKLAQGLALAGASS